MLKALSSTHSKSLNKYVIIVSVHVMSFLIPPVYLCGLLTASLWSDVLEAESQSLLVMVVWRQERESGEAVLRPGPLPSSLTAWLRLQSHFESDESPGPGTGRARPRPLLRYSDPSNFVISSLE